MVLRLRQGNRDMGKEDLGAPDLLRVVIYTRVEPIKFIPRVHICV